MAHQQDKSDKSSPGPYWEWAKLGFRLFVNKKILLKREFATRTPPSPSRVMTDVIVDVVKSSS